MDNFPKVGLVTGTQKWNSAGSRICRTCRFHVLYAITRCKRHTEEEEKSQSRKGHKLSTVSRARESILQSGADDMTMSVTERTRSHQP